MKRYACLTLLPLTCSTFALAQPPVVPANWGNYSLSLTENNGPVPSQRLTVKQAGKTVLSVTDRLVDVQLIPLRPGGLPELVLSAYSGGAHCCTTVLMYTQDNGKLENIGVLEAGNYPPGFYDLNGDGTKEVLLNSDSLAYYDWAFAVSPSLRTVIGWDGTRLAGQTRRYAYVPTQEAQRNLKAMQNPQVEWDTLKANLGGYYGNMLLAGQGAAADKFLKSQFFVGRAKLESWFNTHRAGLVNAAYAQPETRLTLNDSPVYPWPEPQQ